MSEVDVPMCSQASEPSASRRIAAYHAVKGCLIFFNPGEPFHGRAETDLQGYLTNKKTPLGPYRKPTPGVLGGSCGVGLFV